MGLVYEVKDDGTVMVNHLSGTAQDLLSTWGLVEGLKQVREGCL